jgi:hypothetical protein
MFVEHAYTVMENILVQFKCLALLVWIAVFEVISHQLKGFEQSSNTCSDLNTDGLCELQMLSNALFQLEHLSRELVHLDKFTPFYKVLVREHADVNDITKSVDFNLNKKVMGKLIFSYEIRYFQFHPHFILLKMVGYDQFIRPIYWWGQTEYQPYLYQIYQCQPNIKYLIKYLLSSKYRIITISTAVAYMYVDAKVSF